MKGRLKRRNLPSLGGAVTMVPQYARPRAWPSTSAWPCQSGEYAWPRRSPGISPSAPPHLSQPVAVGCPVQQVAVIGWRRRYSRQAGTCPLLNRHQNDRSSEELPIVDEGRYGAPPVGRNTGRNPLIYCDQAFPQHAMENPNFRTSPARVSIGFSIQSAANANDDSSGGGTLL